MMIPKPFDVHLLRAAIRQIGSRGLPDHELTALAAGEVYKLLRLGLLETEATPKPDTTPGWEGDTRSTVI